MTSNNPNGLSKQEMAQIIMKHLVEAEMKMNEKGDRRAHLSVDTNSLEGIDWNVYPEGNKEDIYDKEKKFLESTKP